MNSDQDRGMTMADLIFDLLYNTKTGRKLMAVVEKYIELCSKHKWLGIISYIGISIAFIPVVGWFFAFLERLVEMMFVLAILLIGGFISLVSSFFKK